MNNEPFMIAVVDMIIFLEFSNPAIVDQDAAIGIMEQIAATLQKLDPTDKEQFQGYLKRRASLTESEIERQLLENFASNLALTAE